MRTASCTLVLIACTIAWTSQATGQQGTGAPGLLQGVWRATDVTVIGGPEAGTYPAQPSLYIFTREHYSIAFISGRDSRPPWPSGSTRATLTDQQVRQTFEPYNSNSGRYSVQGNTLTITPSVALAPPYMAGGSDSFQVEVRGNTLILTDTNMAAPITSVRRTLTRVE
jgi:hypothetical protein